MSILSEAFLSREHDDRPGCTLDGRTTPWNQIVSESVTRAEILRNFLHPARPERFAILVDDQREHMFWMGAALLSGACMTALDSARSDSINTSALESSDNQFVVADDASLELLDSWGASVLRTVDLKSSHFLAMFDGHSQAMSSISKAKDGNPLFSLIIDGPGFRSTMFDVTDETVSFAANQIVRATEMTNYDICFDSLPLSCANSVLACWGPAVMTGAEIVFERHFEANRFLRTAREFNCTYFVFAGSMISDLLALPESDLDRDHQLRVGFGTESTPIQRSEFRERFGCELVDAAKWQPSSLLED